MQGITPRSINGSRREDLIVLRALEESDWAFRKQVLLFLVLIGGAWAFVAYLLFTLCAVSGVVLALAVSVAVVFVVFRVPRLGVQSNDVGLEIRSPLRTVFIRWERLAALGWCVLPGGSGPFGSPEVYYPAFVVEGRRLPVVVGVRHIDVAARLDVSRTGAIHALEGEARRLGVAYRERIPNLSPGMLTTIYIALLIGLPVVVMLGGWYICRLPI